MQQSVLKNLQSEIDEIWFIYVYLKDAFAYSYYLHNPATIEEKEYLHLSQDFIFIKHSLFRTTIIELAKLFTKGIKSNNFNIYDFIKKFEKNNSFSSLSIDITQIEKWNLFLNDNENIIKDIQKLRHNYYAHTYKKRKETKFETDFDFKQIKILLTFIEEVISYIYSTFFKSSIELENLTFDVNSFNIIKILAKHKDDEIRNFLGPKFKYKNK